MVELPLVMPPPDARESLRRVSLILDLLVKYLSSSYAESFSKVWNIPGFWLAVRIESIPPAYFLANILGPVLFKLGISTSIWSAPLVMPLAIRLRFLIPGFAVSAPYILFYSSPPPNITLTRPSLGWGTNCWTSVDLVKNLFLSLGRVDPPFA